MENVPALTVLRCVKNTNVVNNRHWLNDNSANRNSQTVDVSK